MATSTDEFQIGLAMSGAVSAGAYTAGVFDFLVQALDEWENARAGDYRPDGIDPEKIPGHKVRLKVMSGASAGAITAAIGAVALADADQKPRSFDAPVGGTQPYLCYLPKLYETWVVKPDLAVFDDLKQKPKNGPTDFLDTIDVSQAPDKPDDFSRTSNVPSPDAGTPLPVVSLLNWRLLDDIAKAALDVSTVRDEKAADKTMHPRAYVSKTLHIYLTLSNLRGVPYKIPFDGGDYHMISHGDRVHYQVEGVGTWETKSEFADTDAKRVIDVACLKNGNTSQTLWKDFSICSLASAAFPVGLAPRDIGATLGQAGAADEYKDRHFPVEGLGNGHSIQPDWPASVEVERNFWFRTADGGIIDNDPFEYARFTLKDDPSKPNESALDKVDRAVIMISPFPEASPIRPEGQPGIDIMSVFSALLPSLIDQARFKPTELVNAANEKYGSRYLIGPSRVLPETDAQGRVEKDAAGKVVWKDHPERYGIASGLLGGFGGFLSREFRDHDFQLGRRNCQRFLKQAFALPMSQSNVIGLWSDEAKADHACMTLRTSDEDSPFYTIIPLFGTARAEVTLPPWAQVDENRLKTLETRIAQRFDVVAPRLIDQNVRGFLGILLRISIGNIPVPGLALIRTRILEFVRLSIRADLVRRNQIKEWNDLGTLPAKSELDPDDIRAVLAEFVNPSFDQRTVAGLVLAMMAQRPRISGASAEPKAVEEKVEKLLAECLAADDNKPYKVWEAPWKDKEQQPLYTLQSRADKMSWWDRRAIPAGIRVSEALTRTPLKQIAGWVPAIRSIGDLFPKPRTDPPGVA